MQDIEQMSIEELASLVGKAEKLLEKRQEEMQAEIMAWIGDMVFYREMDFEALERELFEKTQSVIDMLQRYLDKKGSKMDKEYEAEKQRLFNKHGWEQNILTEKLFSYAYQEGHASGWSGIDYYMSDMDDILQAAKQHYSGK